MCGLGFKGLRVYGFRVLGFKGFRVSYPFPTGSKLQAHLYLILHTLLIYDLGP